MAKLILAALAMLFITLFASGDFAAEGIIHGGLLPATNPSRVTLASHGRLVSWGCHQYRPGRVYWRIALSS